MLELNLVQLLHRCKGGDVFQLLRNDADLFQASHRRQFFQCSKASPGTPAVGVPLIDCRIKTVRIRISLVRHYIDRSYGRQHILGQFIPFFQSQVQPHSAFQKRI